MDRRADRCVLCQSNQVATQLDGRTRMYYVECVACGRYNIDVRLHNRMKDFAEYQDQAYVLSALSRELSETKGEPLTFLMENWEKNLRHYLIPDLSNPTKRAERFLQAVHRMSDSYGHKVAISYARDFPLAYSRSVGEFKALIELLVDRELLATHPLEDPNGTSQEQLRELDASSDFRVRLTARGWDQVDELGKKNVDSNQAFVAMWFDNSMTENKEAILLSIETTEFTPMCIDEEHFAEGIMEKALSEIRKSRFMVADLTGNRRSVFFEIGFAKGLGIEIIYLLDKRWKDKNEEDKRLEFYVKHYTVYQYGHPDEIGELLADVIGARFPT